MADPGFPRGAVPTPMMSMTSSYYRLHSRGGNVFTGVCYSVHRGWYKGDGIDGMYCRDGCGIQGAVV